jgi:CHAD domain-containing protein
MIESIAKLVLMAPANLQKELESLKKQQQAQRSQIVDQYKKQDDSLSKIIEEVETLKHRISTWPLKNEEFDIWAIGLKKTYKKGRQLCRLASNSDSSHDFHQWRKQVKYLWNQLVFLQKIWPPIIDSFTQQLSVLSSLLGDEHDLSVLRESMSNGYLQYQVTAELDTLITSQIKELRIQSLALGKLIYAEKSSNFFARKSHYWAVMRG